MKTIILLLSLVLISGCRLEDEYITYEAVGKVRNVWYQGTLCGVNVSFEFDNRQAALITFCDRVPFWQDEHVRIRYKCKYETCRLLSTEVIHD